MALRPVSPEASLIEYPSQFPIKVMGANVDGFAQTVLDVVREFDPSFGADAVEMRQSKEGRYLAVTVTITATSRAQLDGLYLRLSSHPMVKVVL